MKGIITEVDPSDELAIFGAGGHAASVGAVAIASGYKSITFIDDRKSGQLLLGFPVLEEIRALESQKPLKLAIAVGDNYSRALTLQRLSQSGKNIEFPSVFHPTAVVSAGAVLGRGTVLMPGAIVGPNSTIGDFCLINSGAIVEHDCILEDFASLAPGAILCGGVVLGACSAICAGAVVRHAKRIGKESVVGAASFVNSDLPDNVVAYGSPARIKRGRVASDPYM